MKLKKIVAAVAAAAIAVTTMAFSAFAETVEIDSEYPGSWTSTGKGITKEQLLAVGGDVKVVLDIEVYNPYGLADQFLVNVIDYDNGWTSQTVTYLTSDTITAKTDGWICVQQDATSLEFVLDQAAIADLGDDGITFSVQNVIVKSATYELASAKEAALNLVSDADGKAYCFTSVNDTAASDDTAAASEETPAADSTTTSTTTGNTASAVMLSVMAAAGVAAAATKKRK